MKLISLILIILFRQSWLILFFKFEQKIFGVEIFYILVSMLIFMISAGLF